jgi:DNA-binding CsgD family transcriptional regulator
MPPVPDPYFSIHASTVDAAVEAFQALYGEVQVDFGSRRLDWRAKVANFGPIAFVQGSCDTSVAFETTPRAHLLTMMIRSGARVAALGGTAEIAAGRSAVLVSSGHSSAWDVASGFGTMSIRIDPDFLLAELEALTGTTVSEVITFALSMPTDAGPGAFLKSYCHFLTDEIINRGVPLEHPVVMSGLLQTFARSLLVGQPHNHSYLLEKPAPPSSRTVVRLVEEYVDAHAAEAIRTTDLAALTGASGQSIEQAFRVHRGTTPAAFVRERRLALARRMLLGAPQVPVPQVAQAAGFLRVEIFEAAYVKAFGERPTETRHRGLIAQGAPPPQPAERQALAARIALLTPREREICERAARGMLNKQIAGDLDITERTVKEHRGRAMHKLGLTSAAALGSLFKPAGE